MSDLMPLNETIMTTGRGGYGFDSTPRKKNKASIPKDKLGKVQAGSSSLKYQELQKMLASLIIDAG